ncbi:hypothetical protein GGF43_006845, partial [Coemansia sp. RSA 2618]
QTPWSAEIVVLGANVASEGRCWGGMLYKCDGGCCAIPAECGWAKKTPCWPNAGMVGTLNVKSLRAKPKAEAGGVYIWGGASEYVGMEIASGRIRLLLPSAAGCVAA